MELAHKNETALFWIAAVISLLFWIALIIGTVGIALIYILIGYLIYLFAHSAFITQLKGTGVRVTESQYPDLYRRLNSCCEKVGLSEIPEMYLLRTDFFNALATRFLGRHFIVLFTDVVDALDTHPGALDFYIGHEIGHIHRKHLRWNAILFPALILPVLGTAYTRTEEYTCDRYGAVCCESEADIRVAIAAIAAGNSRCKSINSDVYLEQIAATNGFWMSFNELTSDYPWLTKRMASALAFKKGQKIKHPRRNIFAWILSIFVPRFGAGGAPSILITVALIGILAAIALPAYQDYVLRALYTAAYQQAVPLTNKITEYAQSRQEWPESLVDLGYESAKISGSKGLYSISIYENGVIGIFVGTDNAGEEKYIVLKPSFDNGEISWACFGQNLPDKLLPPECR